MVVRMSMRHDARMNDLRYRVGHHAAPRINQPGADPTPRTPPPVSDDLYDVGIRRALHGALMRHGGGARELGPDEKLALEYDSAEAVKEWFATEGITMPRFTVQHDPPTDSIIVVGGLLLSVAEFAQAIRIIEGNRRP